MGNPWPTSQMSVARAKFMCARLRDKGERSSDLRFGREESEKIPKPARVHVEDATEADRADR
jgi:hypothetical protein